MNRTVTGLAAVVAVGMLTTAASAGLGGLGPKTGFDVFSVDAKGGGWVINHLPGRGDTLWGCADVTAVESCQQVYFDEWKSASTMSMIHVSKDSQNAWFKLSAPAMGDYLYSCKTPEGTPTCTLIDLELRMGMASIARTWPPYGCTYNCDKDEDPVGKDDPRYYIEDKAKADMWIEVGLKVPGPSNMYACKGLGGDAVCTLAVPNWLAFDREDLGFKKLADIVTEGPDGEKVYGPGVTVDKIDEGTVAYEAGLREGDVIIKVGPTEVNKAIHAKYMMLQYPALTPFTVTKQDGSTVELNARRKPKK